MATTEQLKELLQLITQLKERVKTVLDPMRKNAIERKIEQLEELWERAQIDPEIIFYAAPNEEPEVTASFSAQDILLSKGGELLGDVEARRLKNLTERFSEA